MGREEGLNCPPKQTATKYGQIEPPAKLLPIPHLLPIQQIPRNNLINITRLSGWQLV